MASAVKTKYCYFKVILRAKHDNKWVEIIRLRAHFAGTDKNNEKLCKRQRLNEDLDSSVSDDSFKNNDEESFSL